MLKLLIFEEFKVKEAHKKSVTHSDYFRLMDMIKTDVGKEEVSPQRLHQLFLALTYSVKYDSNDIPENFVRMNSSILITNSEHEKQRIRIVYPGEVKSNDDYSIYSMLGFVCLGHQEGEVVTYMDGEKLKQLRIEKIISH
jgi:transcription elongation GreA/GreB family factor